VHVYVYLPVYYFIGKDYAKQIDQAMGRNADVMVQCVGGHLRDLHHIIDDMTKHDG